MRLSHAIFKAGSLYIIPKVFAALVVIIVLALCLTYVVGKIERCSLGGHTDHLDHPRFARKGVDECKNR
jgi:ABC-type nitrate/sulfonate/bicarbonate transport system permease component